MPTTRRVNTVPAGGTVENILDGSLYEFIRQGGNMVVAAVTDNTANEAQMSVLIDSDTVMEESAVPTEPAANVGPNLQDDILVNERVTPGDKITVRLRNSGAAPVVVRTLVSVP